MEHVVELFKAQDGKCPICGEAFGGFDDQAFVIDHDHGTVLIRGLLCQPCNMGLGSFRDDVDRLVGAATYLLRADELRASV